MRHFVPLLAIACILRVPLGAEEGESGEAAAPRHLDVPARLTSGEGPLDWVLSKVTAGRDEWRLEGFATTAHDLLEKLATFLASAEPVSIISSLLAPDFRGTSVLPGREKTILERADRGAWRGVEGSARRDLEAAQWTADLVRLRGLFRSVEKARFKVYETRGQPNGKALVATRALLEMNGRDGKGHHFQVRADWQVEWRSRGGEWRITSMQLGSFERARLARRFLRDVTRASLGSSASYRQQLALGLDHWWKRLDAASGIDIYGHQGVAVGDFDGDGWEDFYVAQPAGLPNRLFRNLGGGRFSDVTEEAGVGILDSTGGPLFLDLDGDGDLDLVVPTALGLLLLENHGAGRFREREGCGFDAISSRQATTMGCAAADHDLDGDLDLYVFSYIFWAGAGSKLSSSYPYPYHDANNGAPNFLFRNEGNLRFVDVTRSSGMGQNNRRFSLAASWSDYDSDGDPDLYVANDFGKNNLYRNEGNGKFRDVAVELGVEDTGNGMSVTWEDFDADGLIDLYVGNMWSSAGKRIALQPRFGDPELRKTYLRMARGNSLFRNLGSGRLEDVTLSAGVSFGRWSWAAQFVDFDGDGNEDLYVTNGFLTGESREDL